MNDLISRQMAIIQLSHNKTGDDDCDVVIQRDIETIKSLPSAQSEIVRCKDCRWRKDQSGSTAWLPCRALVTPEDFYCGRAERRTD